VERANRTHSKEFYPVTPCSLEMKTLNRELRQWEKSTTPSASSVPGLPDPATVRQPNLIPTKGTKGMKLSLIYWTSTESILYCRPHQLLL
jgi:hypothetical protein